MGESKLGLLVAVLVVLAGCGGGGVTTFEAGGAAVSEDVVADTDYEYNGTDTDRIQRTFEVVGNERNVTVVNRVTTYDKAVEVAGGESRRLAALALLSSPSVGLAGSEFNPIADLSARELAERLSDRREGLTIGRQVGNSTVDALGAEVTVSRFAGTQSLGPSEMEVTVQVARVKHEDDFVVAFAVHPRRIDDAQTVERMIDELVHPA